MLPSDLIFKIKDIDEGLQQDGLLIALQVCDRFMVTLVLNQRLSELLDTTGSWDTQFMRLMRICPKLNLTNKPLRQAVVQRESEEIRTRCYNIQSISTCVQQRRLRWFGHILRRSNGELVKAVLNPAVCPGWRCRSGGQLKTWLSTVKSDVECLGLQSVYGTFMKPAHPLVGDSRSKVTRKRMCDDIATLP